MYRYRTWKTSVIQEFNVSVCVCVQEHLIHLPGQNYQAKANANAFLTVISRHFKGFVVLIAN